MYTFYANICLLLFQQSEKRPKTGTQNGIRVEREAGLSSIRLLPFGIICQCGFQSLMSTLCLTLDLKPFFLIHPLWRPGSGKPKLSLSNAAKGLDSWGHSHGVQSTSLSHSSTEHKHINLCHDDNFVFFLVVTVITSLVLGLPIIDEVFTQGSSPKLTTYLRTRPLWQPGYKEHTGNFSIVGRIRD